MPGFINFIVGFCMWMPQSWARPNTAAQLQLGLENRQYVSSQQQYFRPGASESMSAINIDAQIQNTWSKIHLANQFNAEEGSNYPHPYEAYIHTNSNKPWVFSLGRRLHTWSHTDELWHRGLWQPRFSDDKLETSQAGLVAGFIEFKRSRWHSTLALSPIFIPDMGPQHDIEDGRFVSRNPWFRPPVSAVNIGANNYPIHYTLNKPDAGDVVNNPGLALSQEWSDRRQLVRLSYAYKPMPQMMLGFPLQLHAVENAQDYISIEVNPRILYHHLYSLEYHRQLASGWGVEANATFENPVRDSTPSDWVAQETTDTQIVTLTIDKFLETPGPRAAKAYLSYSRVFGGDQPDSGQFATDESYFERRFQFQDAIMVGVKKEWRTFLPRPLETQSQALWELAQHGLIWRLSAGYSWSSAWRAIAQADLIGVYDEQGRIQDGFTNLYRANDRFGVGVSYVY